MANNVLAITSTLDGFVTKSNGTVNIRLKVPYTEIVNYSKLLLLIGKLLKGQLVNENSEKLNLGAVMIDRFNIDKEGELKLTLVGTLAEINMESLLAVIEKVLVLRIKEKEEGE